MDLSRNSSQLFLHLSYLIVHLFHFSETALQPPVLLVIAKNLFYYRKKIGVRAIFPLLILPDPNLISTMSFHCPVYYA